MGENKKDFELDLESLDNVTGGVYNASSVSQQARMLANANQTVTARARNQATYNTGLTARSKVTTHSASFENVTSKVCSTATLTSNS